MTRSEPLPAGTADHIAPATMHTVQEGPATGTRVIVAEPYLGFTVRVLADRGLDVGRTSLNGTPISWTSPVGEQRPGLDDSDEGWHRGWAGGLITTCGLHNVGAPSEGHGRHGRFSNLAADDVTISRNLTGAVSGAITISGTVRDGDALDPGLVLMRKLELVVGRPVMLLRDTTRNESDAAMQAPILYHINFGAPFLRPASRLRPLPRATERTIAVDGRPMGAAAPVADEVVEHRLVGDGVEAGVVLDAGHGPRVRITWDTSTLPRLFTWQRRRAGSYVMAVEPANCGIGGRAADRRAGNAPWLGAGESRTTTLSIEWEDGYRDAESA